MLVDDDTPSDGALPERYPRQPMIPFPTGAALHPRNLFVFEGLDGSGKSTVLRKVKQRLSERGRRVIVRKAGGSELVRHALPRAKWMNVDPISINLLNWASMFEQTSALVPEFDTDSIILFDRYALSNKVRGTLEGQAEDLQDRLESDLPQPTVVFLFDCNPATSLARLRHARREITYFEMGARDVAFGRDPMSALDMSGKLFLRDDREHEFILHERRMREAFRRYAAGRANVVTVDGSKAIEYTEQTILSIIETGRVEPA